MTIFKDKVNIDNFSIENIDISSIEKIIDFLPTSGVIDANIAEMGLVYTLEGQNLCQEKISQIDRWIGYLETIKNKAWSKAALEKSKASGYKTAKDKEWFAQADDDYSEAYNSLALAKACKKWFENKAGYFSGWHYAFKTFLRRDYSIENSTNISVSGYNGGRSNTAAYPGNTNDAIGDQDICGDIDWE
jgi:hypothetical protein|tara:strand:- start:10843 stop:11409 length:567 start_codon:yes stop_codon:yes gene_type:complete